MEGDGGRDGGMEGRMESGTGGKMEGWRRREEKSWEGGWSKGEMARGTEGREEGGGTGEESMGWAGSLYSTVGETLREGRTSLFACGFFTEPSPGVRVQQETDNEPNRNVLEVVLRTRNGGHWVE